MKHFDFPAKFRALYDQAVARYGAGQRGAETFFNAGEKAFLAANGIMPQHMYDYAEDHHGYGGEPGFDHALGIELVRRDYFLNAQGGRTSAAVLDPATMPAKTDTARGIVWLPRILPKARAKLRGEMPPTMMYCCGGDRSFFKDQNILPAEFLAVVWRHEKDDTAIIDWVVRRAGTK